MSSKQCSNDLCDKEETKESGAFAKCSKCKAVFYCSRECQKSDWKRYGHKAACERLKVQMADSTQALRTLSKDFSWAATTMSPTLSRSKWVCWLQDAGLHCYGLWRRECGSFNQTDFGLLDSVKTGPPWELMGVAAPRSDKPPKARLMGWSEYYLARGLDRSSPVAMLMCFVMSLYHLIHQAGLEKLDTLCVHWLGAEKELDGLPLLHELSWLLPNTKFDIVMIGPAVPLTRNQEQLTVAPNVTIRLISALYHTAIDTDLVRCTDADLVVGLNAGLEAYPSYVPTVQKVLQARKPFMCTDYNYESASHAAGLVTKLLGHEISLGVAPNVFVGPRTEKSGNKSYAIPSFSNAFMYGNTKYNP